MSRKATFVFLNAPQFDEPYILILEGEPEKRERDVLIINHMAPVFRAMKNFMGTDLNVSVTILVETDETSGGFSKLIENVGQVMTHSAAYERLGDIVSRPEPKVEINVFSRGES